MDCNCRPMISGSTSLYSSLHLILTLDNPLTAQFNSCQSLSPVSIWANTLSTQLSSYPHIAWRSCHQHPLPCQQLSSVVTRLSTWLHPIRASTLQMTLPVPPQSWPATILQASAVDLGREHRSRPEDQRNWSITKHKQGSNLNTWPCRQ